MMKWILSLTVNALVIRDPRRDVRNLGCRKANKQSVKLLVLNRSEWAPLVGYIRESSLAQSLRKNWVSNKRLCVPQDEEPNIADRYVDPSELRLVLQVN